MQLLNHNRLPGTDVLGDLQQRESCWLLIRGESWEEMRATDFYDGYDLLRFNHKNHDNLRSLPSQKSSNKSP
jgi:hypothetical protein